MSQIGSGSRSMCDQGAPVRRPRGPVPSVRRQCGHLPSVRRLCGRLPSIRRLLGHLPSVRRVALLAALLVAVCGTAGAFEPAVNYMLQCMGCHTPDGSGEPGRVPSMRMTLAALAVVPEGRRFLVQVPGSDQSTLSDAELAELLNWMIRNFSSQPKSPDFARYTAQEVARYRRTPLIDVRGTRKRLLELPAVRKSMGGSLVTRSVR